MKKQYHTPQTEEMKLSMASLICASGGGGSEDYGGGGEADFFA